jgi:hypothetical protein
LTIFSLTCSPKEILPLLPPVPYNFLNPGKGGFTGQADFLEAEKR